MRNNRAADGDPWYIPTKDADPQGRNRKRHGLGSTWLAPFVTFILADIPGLIEGAHAGVGLGHEFLRHIERAGILVHLVEPIPFDGTDPLENYRSIRNELVLYNARLGDRPETVVVTKAELPGARTCATLWPPS